MKEPKMADALAEAGDFPESKDDPNSGKKAPEHEHDCDTCRHLETIFIKGEWRDLYFCDRSDGGTLIARYSSDGPDYSSYPLFIWEPRRDTIFCVFRNGVSVPGTKSLRTYHPDIEYAYQLLLDIKAGQRD